MKIECHIIQNFPPHCLNRDDTNSPKDCEFGGVRRARISSQCLKRAVRDSFFSQTVFSPDQRAVRTKRVVENVVERLVEQGKDRELARNAVIAILSLVELKMAPDTEDKTQYLLFLPERKIEQVASLVAENWGALVGGAAQVGDDEPSEGKAKSKAKGKTKSKDSEVPKEAKSAITALLKDATQTPEIALFGRMIANSPDWNVEAACQVAHAISTHRVSMEFDFFTAVDDLKGEAAGSDMMGTVQFNSACFYRYAVVDCAELLANLGGEEQRDLCTSSVKAFLDSFVCARPTGKQNSMAAHTLPSTVLVTLRDKGEPLSLANAFVSPVSVSNRDVEGLDSLSSAKLVQHFERVTEMYPAGLAAAYACSLHALSWSKPSVVTTKSIDELIAKVCSHVANGAKSQ